MYEQIQNISEEILKYKDKFLFKIFGEVLKERKVPFPENTKYYLKLIFNSIAVDPISIALDSIKKENNNYIVSLTGPFDSYVEINGIPTHFNIEGKIDDLKPMIFLTFISRSLIFLIKKKSQLVI